MSGRFGSSSLPLQTVVLGFLHSRHSIIHSLIQWPLGDFPGGFAAFTAVRNSLFEHLFSYLGAFSCTSFHVTNAIHILLGYSYLSLRRTLTKLERTKSWSQRSVGGLDCNAIHGKHDFWMNPFSYQVHIYGNSVCIGFVLQSYMLCCVMINFFSFSIFVQQTYPVSSSTAHHRIFLIWTANLIVHTKNGTIHYCMF